MPIAFVDADMLRTAVRFEDLIEPVSVAFQRYSQRQASSELIMMWPAADPDAGDVYVKTGTIVGHSSFVVKVSPWYAVNAEQKRPQGGFIALCDAETGHTRAIIDDQHVLSDLRTAAAGALVARHLAPADTDSALVVGTGTQAFLQPQALHRERPFRRLSIWGRDVTRAESLAGRLQRTLADVAVSVTDDLPQAARKADVILCATAAKTPLLQGKWLHPGQHVTSIGSDDPTKCELDAECLLRADGVFVDSVDAARANGNVHRHLRDGAISADRVTCELGSVLAGILPGRTSRTELTVATLIGLGVQDLAAAHASLHLLRLGQPP